MTDERDPFEILRRANPVDRERLPDVSESAYGRELLEEIVMTGASTHQASRERARPLARFRLVRRRRVLIPVLVAALLSAGFTFYALRQVTEPLTIGCYAQADLEADAAVVGAGGVSPVAACEELWRQGAIGAGPVPQLAACVLPSGAVGVFPSSGEATCEGLGIAAVDAASYPAEMQEVVSLRTALVDKFLAEECLNQQQAVGLVEDELRARELGDWTVEVSGRFNADRPCASLAFEPESKKVALVPVPPSRS